MHTMQPLFDEWWAFRHEYTDKFPIPDPYDALDFASEEAGEAKGARVGSRGKWVRTHPDKERHSEYYEWAQCALMLMNCLPQGYVFTLGPTEDRQVAADLFNEVGYIGKVAEHHDPDCENEDTRHMLEQLIIDIDVYCVGIRTHAEQWMASLREKFGPLA